jgi:hypothetical protein
MRVASFLAGNAWLMFAMFAWFGRRRVNSQETLYSLFENGVAYNPGEYRFAVGVIVVAAIVCFAIALLPSDRTRAEH